MGPKGAKLLRTYEIHPGMLNKSADMLWMFHVQAWLKNLFFRPFFVCVMPRIIGTEEQ